MIRDPGDEMIERIPIGSWLKGFAPKSAVYDNHWYLELTTIVIPVSSCVLRLISYTLSFRVLGLNSYQTVGKG